METSGSVSEEEGAESEEEEAGLELLVSGKSIEEVIMHSIYTRLSIFKSQRLMTQNLTIFFGNEGFSNSMYSVFVMIHFFRISP